MSVISGLLDWIKSCGLIDEPEHVDVEQLPPGMQSLGIYRQPSRSVDELIDGTQIITDVYCLLFKRPAQVNAERISGGEYLEQVECWVESQEYAGNYPDIGCPVLEIGVANTFYMMERTETEAVYQIAISIKYGKGIKND